MRCRVVLFRVKCRVCAEANANLRWKQNEIVAKPSFRVCGNKTEVDSKTNLGIYVALFSATKRFEWFVLLPLRVGEVYVVALPISNEALF
jgi:hypothetical protein